MAQFTINQSANNLTILPTAEANRAHVYKRDGEQFVDTGELKEIDGIPVWNLPAVLVQEGTTRPVAQKLIVVSEKEPTVSHMVPLEAENLTIDTNGRFHATGVKPAGAGFATPKAGDAK